VKLDRYDSIHIRETVIRQHGDSRNLADSRIDTCVTHSMLGTVRWYVKVPGYTGLLYTVFS
jgi:hypothetical protein